MWWFTGVCMWCFTGSLYVVVYRFVCGGLQVVWWFTGSVYVVVYRLCTGGLYVVVYR